MFTASVTRFGEKFATLAEISRARAMFWVFIKYLAKFWSSFGKNVLLLGRVSLLQMAKN